MKFVARGTAWINMQVWMNNDPSQGRDPNRIDVAIERLRHYWKKHPQLRLGQLISNAATKDSARSIFYIEDDQLIDGLGE